MDIALVGIGKIALDQHVPAINASQDWTLAATVSRSGKVDGVDAYDDFDKLLAERPEIRVISLCLPPVPRFEYAKKAIAAGRHVMLEKPPGATLAECHALMKLAEAEGTCLYATWHSREADKVASAKKWLSDKTLKKLHVTWKEDVRRWHPGQDWIWAPGGMGVFDPGINALSIVTEIMREEIHLGEATLEVPSNCQTPIAAQLSFVHPEGAEVTADLDFLQQGEQTWSIAVETDQGTMALHDGGARMVIDGVEARLDDGNPLSGEYPRLYDKMAALVATGGMDMDLRPMVHVSDALALGRRVATDAFIE